MKMLIDGKNVSASDGKTIDVYNPVTGELIDTVPDASRADVERAVKCAAEGRREWAAVPLIQRGMIFQKFAALVAEHKEELAALLTRESGKPLRDSMMELGSVGAKFGAFVEIAKYRYGRVNPRMPFPGRDKDFQMVLREPLGTVADIIPFNSPVIAFGSKAAPALVMGNAVIVKPASDNPLTLIRLVGLLAEAGVSANAVQIVTGRGENCGSYLCSSPGVNGIDFTGSTAAGLEIARMGDLHLAHSILELGGNDPCVLLEDANVEAAVTDVVRDRLNNAGQICVAPKRLIIHQSIVEQFTKRLLEAVAKVKVGDPFDPETVMGSLISEKAAVQVEAQVKKTVSQGARLLYGDSRNGAFYMPTVLGGVTREMDIAKDMEVFGPVFAVISVKDEDEALSVANQTSYGLSAGVYTENIARGMMMANKIEAGGCVVNGTGFYISPYQPFGGVKLSGKGREGYGSSLDELTYEKTITVRNMYL